MARTMKELGIDQWSVAERIALAQEIWDSIADTEEGNTLTNELKHLLDRRRADLDRHPNRVLIWDTIKQRVRGRG